MSDMMRRMNHYFRIVPSLVFLVVGTMLLGLTCVVQTGETMPTVAKTVQEEPEPVYIPTPNEYCLPDVDESKPYLVTIEQIGILNTCVEQVGISSDGVLGDPNDVMAMGWYTGSVVPMSDGAGLYTCHTSFNPEKLALCTRLGELAVGSEIIIEIASGQKFTYNVQQIKTTLLADVDMYEFQTVYDRASYGINLMTCAGYWNEKTDDASHRLLIWATRD